MLVFWLYGWAGLLLYLGLVAIVAGIVWLVTQTFKSSDIGGYSKDER